MEKEKTIGKGKNFIFQHVVGKFVHVEQKEASRENISLWTSVIEDAFIVGGSSSQLSAVVVISLSVVIVFS